MDESGASIDHYRVVLRSLGTAGPALIPALRQVRGGTDAELASLLYRAPSELVDRVPRMQAEKLCELLRTTGVEADIAESSLPFVAGIGDMETALSIKTPAATAAVVAETVHVLGVDVETAKKLVCAMPAVLLGKVSAATVSSLERRYAALGAELDVSRPSEATFDVVIDPGDATAHGTVRTVLHACGITVPDPIPSCVATGLDWKTAGELWERLARTPARIRVVNRDFQRFDVQIDEAAETPALAEWLERAARIPARACARALATKPLVVLENVRHARMVEALSELRELGASATAVLLAFQRFGLSLAAGGERRQARVWAEAVAGSAVADQVANDARELEGPFTKTQARWLQHELHRAGVRARLVSR